MKHILTPLIIFCLSMFYISCGSGPSPVSNVVNAEQVALADSILQYFQQEQFDKIVRHFNDKVKQQLNKEQLAVVWAQLNTQVGKYVGSEFYGNEKIDPIGDKVVFKSSFGSQKLYFQLILGKENQVIGLF